MRKGLTVTNFGRIVSALEGRAAPINASKMVNFRAIGSKLKFRYGYSNIQASPVTLPDTFSQLGLGYVTNTSGASEFLGVENRNGTTKPYTYNKDTLARTVIGTDTVNTTPWVITSYADNAYFINPGGDATVYRHVIGNSSSFVKLADINYTPPDQSINLTATAQSYSTRWTIKPTDTITITSTDGITGSATSTTNGIITVTGTDNDNGVQHRTLTQIDFGSSADWSDRGYVAIEVTAGAIFTNPGGVSLETTNITPQIKTGGTWRDCEFKEFFDSSTTQVLIVARVKGVTGISAVDGIRFTIGGWVNSFTTGTAYTVNPIKVGGNYLEATNASDRLWDYTSNGTGINYAVRYTQALGAAPQSSVSQKSITAAGAQGAVIADYSTQIGGRTSLSVVAANTGTYTDVEFLRLMEDGVTWKRLGLVANTAGTSPSLIDTYEENELSGLTTVTLTGVDPVDPEPAFSTQQLVGAFPFKQFMIWLKDTGVSNVQMSRVGDAEELYVSDATYDANDLTQPAQRTLADNADDIPLWGTQANDLAFIIGSKAAYVMSGNYPVDMTPCRQIPGSRGMVGRFAGARYRSLSGQYAVAYCDPDFNIWSVQNIPIFNGDGRAEPVELSKPVRGLLKTFLYDEQRYENPDLDLTLTQVEFDESHSTVWVILGNRAAVYRNDLNETGWELYKYALRTAPGETTVSTCTAYSGNGGTATSTGAGDAAWTQLGYPFDSDDAYCESDSFGFGTTKTTKTLSITGLVPVSLIPAAATITSLKYRAEFSKTGDLAVTNIDAQPTLSSVASGTDRSTGITLTTTDQTEEYTPSVTPTVANINGSECGLDLRFQQETWLSAWNTLSNWTIVVSPTSPNDYDYTTATVASHTTNFTVTYTWIGGGTAPTEVWASFTGATSLSCVSPVSGTGDTDNGLGDTASGVISNTPAIPPADPVIRSLATNGTHTERLTLTAGVATKNITMVSTSSVPPAKMRASHELTATIYTPTPATVKVDAVQLKVCYQTTTSASAPNWIGWDQVCFTHDGRNVAARSTGEMDIVEWDFRSGSYVESTNRDGGYTPSDAEWYSQDFTFEGIQARVNGAQIHTTLTTDTFTAYDKVEGGSYVAGFGTGLSTSRWVRFPLTQRGIRHVLKFTFPESLGGIEGIFTEFELASSSRPR